MLDLVAAHLFGVIVFERTKKKMTTFFSTVVKPQKLPEDYFRFYVYLLLLAFVLLPPNAFWYKMSKGHIGKVHDEPQKAAKNE